MRWTNRPTFQQVMSSSPAHRDAVTLPLGSTSWHEKRYLLTPGPTPVPPEVLAAGAAPVIHHRGPDFRELMRRTLARLQEVCRTSNDVLLFTASGSGAFESAIVNLLSPGERMLVVSAGAFGERWCAMARLSARTSHDAPVRLGRDAAAGRPPLAARGDAGRRSSF